MKRSLLLLLFCLALVTFGCAKETGVTQKPPLAKIGFYFPAYEDYFGDLYDYEKIAAEKIQKEFQVKVEFNKVRDTVYEYAYAEQLARNNDILVFMNFPLNYTYSELTGKYPQKYFIGIESYIDGNSYDEPANGSGIFARDEQGAYLAGILAAELTTESNIPGINKEKKVGFIGAVPSPWFMRDLGGYQYGIWKTDPTIKIYEVWGNIDDPQAFNRPDWAYVQAKKLYEQGVDIIFTVAGKGDDGVCKAAKEKGKYVITMNTYKGYLAPGHVLAGVNRRVDVMIYKELKDFLDQKRNIQNGTLKAVNFHAGSYKYGIPEGAIELSDLVGMDEEEAWLKTGKIAQKDFDAIKLMKSRIPLKIIQDIADAKNNVISGQVEVREGTGPVVE